MLVVSAAGGLLLGRGTAGAAIDRRSLTPFSASRSAAAAIGDQMCDGAIDRPQRFLFPQRWGTSAPDPLEPPLSACGEDGTSRRLIPGPVVVEGDSEVFVSYIEEKHARRGDHRRLEVSFLVPSDSMATFNHVAALVSYDPSDDRYRRTGGAVFADRLYVEVEDPGCGLDTNLQAGVEIPGGLKPDRWYRLLTELEPEGGGNHYAIRAQLVDLEEFTLVATSEFHPACALRWVATACTSFGLLATVPVAQPTDPGEILIDDYFVEAKAVRASTSLPGAISRR